MSTTSCIFCRIIRKEVPTTMLFEDDHCIVIKDIAPKAEIHWLVMPKVHIEDLRAAMPAHQQILGSVFITAATVVREHADDRAFKLVANNGHEAGQRVFHFHMHILIGFLGNIAYEV